MTGDELRQRRLALGLSLTEMAERLGVDRQTLWRWEHGIMRMRHPEIVSLMLEKIEAEAAGRS